VIERHVLALNVGSTTLKAAAYSLLDEIAGALPRSVELGRAELPAGGATSERLGHLLESLPGLSRDPELVVHRIVHGGSGGKPREVDDALLAELEAIAPLAPLHQPTALAFVREARRRWPRGRHGVAFDTSFHAELAAWSRRLPIPAAWDALGVRRYGFHGLAFASALRAVKSRDASIADQRAVFAHLGGGCSVCAVDAGVSRDTTMGVSPLGGVSGPTRSGDLDPSAVLYLLRQGGLHPDRVEGDLMHHSGLAGIAGHGDMRSLVSDPAPLASLAIEQFVVRIAQSIAAMGTAMGGLDHLVFSGGIGHRAPSIRSQIVAKLEWLGLTLDCTNNDAGSSRIDAGTGPRIWNIAVDEERELVDSTHEWR
jgi:acetate kinase